MNTLFIYIYMIFEHNYANATQAPLNNTSTSVTKKRYIIRISEW